MTMRRSCRRACRRCCITLRNARLSHLPVRQDGFHGRGQPHGHQERRRAARRHRISAGRRTGIPTRWSPVLHAAIGGGGGAVRSFAVAAVTMKRHASGRCIAARRREPAGWQAVHAEPLRHASARSLSGAAGDFWTQPWTREIDMPGAGQAQGKGSKRGGAAMFALYDRDGFSSPPRRIRRARRAYYSMISYLRRACWAGLPGALETSGIARQYHRWSSASDHGDMLGERGLWYKMTFYGARGAGAADRRGARDQGGDALPRRSRISTCCRRWRASPARGEIARIWTGATCRRR